MRGAKAFAHRPPCIYHLFLETRKKKQLKQVARLILTKSDTYRYVPPDDVGATPQHQRRIAHHLFTSRGEWGGGAAQRRQRTYEGVSPDKLRRRQDHKRPPRPPKTKPSTFHPWVGWLSTVRVVNNARRCRHASPKAALTLENVTRKCNRNRM